ncbi:MAG: hypothetical protein H6827_00110 [Planctomycetes bacterium]|nr:hypothetical protein [Planctomycetota bacterium]
MKHFATMGLGTPRRLTRGGWTMLYWKKRLVCEENVHIGPGGDVAVFSGSLCYRGKVGVAGLQGLLQDEAKNAVDETALVGSFVLFLLSSQGLTVREDGSGVRSVFVDTQETVVSTSFLAVLTSLEVPFHLDLQSCLQKFSLGYILRPRTVLNEIESWCSKVSRRTGKGLRFWDGAGACMSPEEDVCMHDAASFREAVREQVLALRRYRDAIRPLLCDYECDLGLSGGYDSRLLALLLGEAGIGYSVHTHLQSGSITHRDDLPVVEDLARRLGVQLRVVRSKNLFDLSCEELETICADNLAHFDGRTGDNGGGINTTYTGDYKARTLGGAQLRLNGEGGEVYRNYFVSPPWRVDFAEWLRDRVSYRYCDRIVRDSNTLRGLLQRSAARIGQRIGIEASGRATRRDLQKYYAEVHLSDCEGFMADAEAKHVHFVMPFADCRILASALRAHAFVGPRDALEVAIIRELDGNGGRGGGRGGAILGEVSAKERLGWCIRCVVSRRLRRRASRVLRGKPSAPWEYQAKWKALIARSAVLRRAKEAFCDLLPELDFDWVLMERSSAEAALAFGYLLSKHAGIRR